MQQTYKLFTLFICSLSLLFFTSAAVAPAKVVEETPVERTTLSKKQQKKQLRQQAKVARLEARLERATSDKAKFRIQKRIKAVKDQKETSTLAIIALIFAFIFPLVGLILAIIAKKNDDGIVAKLAFWFSLIFLILALIGIILVFVFLGAAASTI